MMDAGIEPVIWTSELTGESKRIYDNLLSIGAIFGEENLKVTIENITYIERDEDKQNRVLKEKKQAYAIAKAHVDEVVQNANVIPSQLITTYVAGVGTSGDQLVAGTYPCVGTVMTPTSTPLKIY